MSLKVMSPPLGILFCLHSLRPEILQLLLVPPGTHKAACEGPVQQFFRQLERELLEVDEVDGMGDYIPRLAAPKLLRGRLVMLFDEGAKRSHWTFQALRCAKASKDL